MERKKTKKTEMHECCPKEWRNTPRLTGDYDFDESIMHRNNKDLPHRLELYLKGDAYGPLTAYNGYRGYSGDN